MTSTEIKEYLADNPNAKLRVKCKPYAGHVLFVPIPVNAKEFLEWVSGELPLKACVDSFGDIIVG